MYKRPANREFALQAELTTSLTKGVEKIATAREADQAAGASAAQLASRQAQEQVSISISYIKILFRSKSDSICGMTHGNGEVHFSPLLQNCFADHKES